MKNKLTNNVIYTVFTFILTGFNLTFATTKNAHYMKLMASKYIMAMFIVGIFFIVITVGLSLYNNLFVKKQLSEDEIIQDSLKTPEDKEFAIKLFVSKNRMK